MNTRRELTDDETQALLDGKRALLDQIDPNVHPKFRRFQAFELGCGSAVSNGAKDRALRPEKIFIPAPEMIIGENGIWISSLNLELPEINRIPTGGITFERVNGRWVLEGQTKVEPRAVARKKSTTEIGDDYEKYDQPGGAGHVHRGAAEVNDLVQLEKVVEVCYVCGIDHWPTPMDKWYKRMFPPRQLISGWLNLHLWTKRKFASL